MQSVCAHYFHTLATFLFADPKIVEVYEKVGLVLSRYKSGKIPKAFKVVPTLKNWEEILALTAPQNWTPNAMFEATRIFTSSLPPRAVEIFYRNVLLESVRRNFYESRAINVHYFQALKQAIYKPAAFFKGIIFPICQDEHTTLKEANVYCGVIAKASIPSLHAAAALMKISTGPYSGPKFMFIRCLLEKKFALPTKAVIFVLAYFCSFADGEQMPVIWHQALLVLAQRYKLEFDDSHKAAIKVLTSNQQHEQISPEVLREIDSI